MSKQKLKAKTKIIIILIVIILLSKFARFKAVIELNIKGIKNTICLIIFEGFQNEAYSNLSVFDIDFF
jgi:hypothetical protein